MRVSAPGEDTFPRLLESLLRNSPGRPLVTAYDEATGDRTELSVTTYANWVAKTANLLLEEYLLDPGDRVRLALPPHWLTTVFLGAAWSTGLVISTDPGVTADLVITGPEHDGSTEADSAVLACSLLPFAVRFPDPLPAGVDDFGLLWPGQPDAPPVVDAPTGATIGWLDAAGSHSQSTLLDAARAASAGWHGNRLITDVGPSEARGTSTFLAALVRSGSLVLVANARDERWPARLEGERATDVLRSSPEAGA